MDNIENRDITEETESKIEKTAEETTAEAGETVADAAAEQVSDLAGNGETDTDSSGPAPEIKDEADADEADADETAAESVGTGTPEESAEAAESELDKMIESAKEINKGEESAEESEDEEKKSPFTIFFDIAQIISLATIIVGLAFIFCFRTVGVSGSSMVPTLHDEDRIILSAFVIEPRQGDIVVTCQPSAFSYIESTLVKRVIATEGQSVDIDFDEGIVYVDGEPLDEPYVNELTHDRESFAPLTVPEDYVFVMGDNRNASTDSRDYRVGLIREDYIMGKALFRIAPFGQFKIG